ncbi:hypothetical protein OH492_12685 [Vibrio chagasii]|nr:hypothetical protein [Vibrio chagasii]
MSGELSARLDGHSCDDIKPRVTAGIAQSRITSLTQRLADADHTQAIWFLAKRLGKSRQHAKGRLKLRRKSTATCSNFWMRKLSFNYQAVQN